MIINPYIYGQQTSYSLWNAFDADPSIEVINSGKRARLLAAGSVASTVRSDTALSGKVYFELDIGVQITGSGAVGAGVASSDADLAGDPGDDAYGVGFFLLNNTIYFNGALVGTLPGASPGTTGTYRYGVAVDVDSRKVWARRNGQGFYGNPTAGTGQMAVIAGSAPLFAAASPKMRSSSAFNSVDLISNPAEFTGVAPTGFFGGIPA